MRLFDNSIEITLRDNNKILDITLDPDNEDSLTQGFSKSDIQIIAYYLLGLSEAMNDLKAEV